MNIPKNKDKTFYADINIFFSTYLPVYIHKVFNFALYQQGVNEVSMGTWSSIPQEPPEGT